MNSDSAKPLGVTRCGNMEFTWGQRTYVMGIVNVAPDSFSGDGLRDVDAAVAQGQRFAAEGADIIDVGGESTRPDYMPVPVEEELRRVMPVIERLASALPVPVSIDTYKAEVAREAVAAGARMINDVWGLKKDPGLAQVAAEAGIPLVITQNQREARFHDFFPEFIASLKKSMQLAVDAGVRWENIIIDPGIGFGKTVEQNLEILRRLAELKSLGRPILLGTSRKSFIGHVLDLPVDQRLEATTATVAIGIANGADIMRVHDVKQMVRVVRMSDAIVRGKLSWLGIKMADSGLTSRPVKVYLGLGSNLGDRMGNLNLAVGCLSLKLAIKELSSVYETEPVYYREQPLFLNAVLSAMTRLAPFELLHYVKGIEKDLGRLPSFPNAPRTIDIDILFYGDLVVQNAELTIPHPLIAERAFVLVPLAEIAPELVHPLTCKKVGDLLAVVGGRDGIRRIGRLSLNGRVN